MASSVSRIVNDWAPCIVRGLASLLIPPACPACGTPVGNRTEPCRECDEALRRLGAALPRAPDDASVCAAFPFEGTARELVHRTKYGGSRPAAWLLGARMAARLVGEIPEFAGERPILVPVPLHPVRLRQRGYNQAERLARAVARASGLEVRTGILVRARATVSQTTLDIEARRASVSGAFRAVGSLAAASALVLVDDVWTTGATISACREALSNAGAPGPIPALVAARTLSRRSGPKSSSAEPID